MIRVLTCLTFYGGVNEIGGNKILLEDKDTRIFLDFGKRFENRDNFEGMIKPEELLLCWDTLKNIVDRTVQEQFEISRSEIVQNAKTRNIIDIYNRLRSKNIVDETVLLKEVLKTGNFLEYEAKSLIKNIKEEKIEDDMA